MPEHRLQKTRDAYVDPVQTAPRKTLRELYEALEAKRELIGETIRIRLQDLQMEHDESRTP